MKVGRRALVIVLGGATSPEQEGVGTRGRRTRPGQYPPAQTYGPPSPKRLGYRGVAPPPGFRLTCPRGRCGNTGIRAPTADE